MPINPILNGAGNLATSQVTVNTTVTALISSRSARRGVIIQNITGSDKIYIGGPNVSSTTGYQIPAVLNASIYIPTTGALFGICPTTGQTANVLEVYD